jgi:hypothetical protein
MGLHAGLVMIFLFSNPCPFFETPPVLLLVVLARFVLLLVDKRSQPRTETVAIMTLVGARFFVCFGKAEVRPARSYELSVCETLKSPWTQSGILVYTCAPHIASNVSLSLFSCTTVAHLARSARTQRKW